MLSTRIWPEVVSMKVPNESYINAEYQKTEFGSGLVATTCLKVRLLPGGDVFHQVRDGVAMAIATQYQIEGVVGTEDPAIALMAVVANTSPESMVVDNFNLRTAVSNAFRTIRLKLPRWDTNNTEALCKYYASRFGDRRRLEGVHAGHRRLAVETDKLLSKARANAFPQGFDLNLVNANVPASAALHRAMTETADAARDDTHSESDEADEADEADKAGEADEAEMAEDDAERTANQLLSDDDCPASPSYSPTSPMSSADPPDKTCSRICRKRTSQDMSSNSGDSGDELGSGCASTNSDGTDSGSE